MNRTPIGLSILLLALTTGAVGCEDKPAAPLAPTASALAPTKPATAEAKKLTVDKASSKIEFMMDAPQEKIRGRVSGATEGEIQVDPSDLTKIVAVLDWEMCTLGDPLMDLGTVLAYWVEPKDGPALLMHAFGPTAMPGSMTRRELADYYGQKSGYDTSNVLFYYAFGLYKTAVIVQQIYARYVQGFTKDERFAQFDKTVAALSKEAARAVNEGTL